MKLRAQLVLVSLFALCLPWAGCSFVYEMESVLRSGQQDALAAVAESVALLIEASPDVLPQPAADPPAAEAVYFHDADRLPTLDGYADDADVPDERGVVFVERGRPEAPLSAEFFGVVAAREAYIFIRVTDATVSYRNPSEGDEAMGDHIVIAAGAAGAVRRYWLAPEAPGEFVARYRRAGGFVTEQRIRAVWRDHADGYQVELLLPLGLLGGQFGFAAVDRDRSGRWAGSMPPGGEPGPAIRADPALSGLLAPFARDNLRLSVIDSGGWLRGRSGGLVYRARADQLPPGGWIVETLYRWVMSSDAGLPGMAQERAARVERDEVHAALAGARGSGWYGVEDERGVAVASVALPLRVDATVVGALLAEQSSSRILSLTDAAVFRLLSLTLVATCVIGFGLVAYASLLSLRIRRLGSSVEAVLGDDGQLSGEFPERWGSDEIGDLGRHFGSLLQRMREYNDYLRTLASKLSHELRTPLAVVGSSLDNLEHEPLSAAGRQYMQRARDGTQRLSRILVAMSEASRVEQSIRSAELAPLDLNALLEKNVASYRQAFGRVIECDVPAAQIVMEGSADLLAQMLDKLMDNAADFCPAGGRIAFGLRHVSDRAIITVENTGRPLPELMRGELFESMVSIRAERDDEPHLGLGLTIVKLVAEFHGGSVYAENLDDGSGARVVVALPM